MLPALAARPFKTVPIDSYTRSKGERFATEIGKAFSDQIDLVDSAKQAVTDADVLTVATSSHSPISKKEWLLRGTHTNSIGPRFRGAHELPTGIESPCDLLVTDSLAQVTGYTRHHFFNGISALSVLKKSWLEKISAKKITLFNSTGLTGTEVLLVNYLTQKYGALPA